MIDPIKNNWCISLYLLAHAICICIFKGERVIVYKWLSVVHLVMSEVAIVLQSKSIKLFRMLQLVQTYVLQQTICSCCIPWILVVYNDPDAGTTPD